MQDNSFNERETVKGTRWSHSVFIINVWNEDTSLFIETRLRSLTEPIHYSLILRLVENSATQFLQEKL